MASPKSSKRVLVVDDEPTLLQMLVEVCRDLGLSPLSAENGGDALAQVASGKPHAVTVDYRLPDMTGMDIIVRMKADAATRDIPVILLSADATLHEEEARAAGAFGVLQKPVTMAALKKMLKECLGPW